jgi:nicotinamide phosphoribosyltransferase
MNLFLMTDVYKFGHRKQYPEGTNKVYSYLVARGSRIDGIDKTIFFGLQYYLMKYLLAPVTTGDVDEFVEIAETILGPGTVDRKQLDALVDLGYLPLHIKAVREGTAVDIGNVLMTITNTHDDFYWLVNYVETLLLKIWYPCSVATISNRYKRLFERFADKTCDDKNHVPFQLHDFGYRGVSSEETAALGGASHLMNFYGTDTTAGVVMLRRYYDGAESEDPIGLSVPASEHSVMCAHMAENDDFPAIEKMLTLYPDGIVSIVSDTYDLWRAIVDGYGGKFKDLVLARSGKTVIRPDSGDPVKIICGDPDATRNSPEHRGVVRLLNDLFGAQFNSKGFKVLNPKIGVIYGDAIFYERGEEILDKLANMGYASSNIVFGAGGLLLQSTNRDTFKFAIKATYCEVNGVPRAIMKDPVTDRGKTSLKGLMYLDKGENSRRFYTIDQCSPEMEEQGYLRTVFHDGNLVNITNMDRVRGMADRKE